MPRLAGGGPARPSAAAAVPMLMAQEAWIRSAVRMGTRAGRTDRRAAADRCVCSAVRLHVPYPCCAGPPAVKRVSNPGVPAQASRVGSVHRASPARPARRRSGSNPSITPIALNRRLQPASAGTRPELVDGFRRRATCCVRPCSCSGWKPASSGVPSRRAAAASCTAVGLILTPGQLNRARHRPIASCKPHRALDRALHER